MGGCKSANLCSIALEISKWCECRNLSLFAVFVPGVTNILADAESRRPLSSGDWKLDPHSFKAIQTIWEVEVDLFANSWNAQLPIFVSRFPQPGAWKTDALSLSWKALAGYCFPPFNLIPFCLTKVRQEQAEIVLVTPYWPSQCWFPSLMELATDIPLLLFPSKSLLTSPLGEGHPLTKDESIRLIAWRLSGVVWKSEAFRKRLSSSYWEQLVQMGSFCSIDTLRRIRKRPGQPLNLAASPQDDHSSCPHLAFEMRRSSCHPAPFHQLLGKRSKVCFEPTKESPTFRPASRAVSRSLAPETRHLSSGLHAELYGPHGSI